MKTITRFKRGFRKQTTGLRLARIWGIIVTLILLGGAYEKLPYPPIVSPLASPVYATAKPTESPKEVNYSDLIEKYAHKYSPTKIKALHLMSIMHCLIWKESWYNENKKCGDNDMACGPWQIWEETWIRFRKEMIKEGLITEIGDRRNPEQATETTAWALTHGKENEWGPIKTKKCY